MSGVMAATVASLHERLAGALIPAVIVPITAHRSVSWESLERYAEYMAQRPIDGVAVWVHTGRGLFLDRETRQRILELWRRTLGPGRVIVAGVGSNDVGSSDDDHRRTTIVMAEDAFRGGADAVMVFPPVHYRDRDDVDARVLEHHRAVATVGGPMLLFHLYREAGGIAYSPPLLRELFALDAVAGIKMATLDSVITYQDTVELAREVRPDATIITGEDRFLPYSFELGASSALIGMAAACPDFQKRLITAWRDADYATFHAVAPRIEAFARAVFARPVDGYIGRLLAILAKQGIIDREAAYDPWGPQLAATDLDRACDSARRDGAEGDPR
jgi:4-hydroxy-tetrahydrodipicolinate synthase